MKRSTMLTLVLTVSLAAPALALQAGDQAPDFKAVSTAGADISLSDCAGSWLVLYFYPKSFTPGCTKEACSLRDGYASIQQMGAKLLGVSMDDVETQKRFRSEYHLPFELLADPDGVLARAFDVLADNGKVARRVTFIIRPSGTIARIIDGVDTGAHDVQVVQALGELQQQN